MLIGKGLNYSEFQYYLPRSYSASVCLYEPEWTNSTFTFPLLIIVFLFTNLEPIYQKISNADTLNSRHSVRLAPVENIEIHCISICTN